jgi:hypothetical protein
MLDITGQDEKRKKRTFFSIQGVQTLGVVTGNLKVNKLGGKAKEMNFQHSSDIIYWATKSISASSWSGGGGGGVTKRYVGVSDDT